MDQGKKVWGNLLDPERESPRWSEAADLSSARLYGATKAIHVMYREGDQFSLFAELVAAGDGFVIPMGHDRLTFVESTGDEPAGRHVARQLETRHDRANGRDEQVASVLEIHRKRWLIEEFFKAIKTGCRFEAHQLETSEGYTTATPREAVQATNKLHHPHQHKLSKVMPITYAPWRRD